MRRALLLAFLVLPAPAGAAVLDAYQDLAARKLKPAPLVFTTLPESLPPRLMTVGNSPRRKGYGLRPFRPGAVLNLEGGSYASVKAGLREFERAGYRRSPTRVRGHAGHLLRRGSADRLLLWKETGVVYGIGSGSPRTVSMEEIRAAAAGLERLGGNYLGTGGDPDLGDGAVAVTTETTITLNLDWGARCALGDGTETSDRAGSQEVSLLPRQGKAFAFDLSGGGWTGSASGEIAKGGGRLDFSATRTSGDETCDTGPKTLKLKPFEPL